MKSSRSRSRNKNRNNNRPSGGNIVNRVFDSSGPEGKVRGTPQQIVEKYTQLHRDSLLARDSVNSENFAQHAEHYTRLLAEAQKEIDAKREEQEKQNRERQQERDRERQERLKAQEEQAAAAPAPVANDETGLVDTPEQSGGKDASPKDAGPKDAGPKDAGDKEGAQKDAPAPKKRRTRKPKTRPDQPPEGGAAPEAAE